MVSKINSLFRFLVVSAGLLASGAFSLSASAQASGVLLDRIVAVVNDGVVLKSQLDKYVTEISAQLLTQGVELPPADVLDKQILERLIMEELQIQRADRLGLTLTDDMVNEGIARIAQRNGLNLAQLPQALAAQGVDYAAYRESVRREMTLEQLRARDLMGRISVTREEAEQYLAKAEAADKSEYEISQILVPLASDASPEEVSAASEKIELVHSKLEEGSDFGSMAVSYSSGQQALTGGKIGWRKRQELPSIFAEAVAALPEGGFSDPIRSNSGFHIVKLDQKRGEEARTVMVTERLARHILVAVNEVRTDATAEAKAQTLYQRLRDGGDFTELAKDQSDDRGSASSGGELGWTGPGVFVPAFEAKLKTLQIGEVSTPIKSQFGWHIIELMDIREEDKTAESSINEAAGQIRVRKAQEEAEGWLTRMRDDAFVEYRL